MSIDIEASVPLIQTENTVSHADHCSILFRTYLLNTGARIKITTFYSAGFSWFSRLQFLDGSSCKEAYGNILDEYEGDDSTGLHQIRKFLKEQLSDPLEYIFAEELIFTSIKDEHTRFLKEVLEKANSSEFSWMNNLTEDILSCLDEDETL